MSVASAPAVPYAAPCGAEQAAHPTPGKGSTARMRNFLQDEQIRAFYSQNMVRKGNQEVEEAEASTSPRTSRTDAGSEISKGVLAALSSGDGGHKREQGGLASPTFLHGQRVGAKLDAVPRKGLMEGWRQ